MSTKKVLIVGGAGFIGSNINKLLYQAGYETVVFDNLSRGNAKAVTHGHFFHGDLADSEDLDTVFRRFSFSAVMHFAAYTDVGESMQEPAMYYVNNVANTLNLLEAMRKHRVRTFIFSSSAAVYGIPQEPCIEETHPCKPINPYGETKLMVEHILRDYSSAYGLRSCALRYFNAAGGDPEGEIKNYKTRENNLIPLALRSLLKPGGHLSIFGSDYPTPDGTCIRDYIHVYDLGVAHLRAMERLLEGKPSGFYNLGNGQGFSVREVLQSVEQVTGQKLHIVESERRPGDPPILVASAEKARQELGWKPVYPNLREMISHAWEAMQLCPH